MKTYQPKAKPIKAMQFVASDPKTWYITAPNGGILTVLKNPIDGVNGFSTGYSIWRNLETRPATDRDGYQYYKEWMLTHFMLADASRVVPMKGTSVVNRLDGGDYISFDNLSNLVIYPRKDFEEKFETDS